MDRTSSLGWAQAQARSRETVYRRVLGLNLTVYGVLAVVAIIAPSTLLQIFVMPLPGAAAWVSAWGALLLILCAFYLPGYLHPLRFRYANVLGSAARFLLAVVYLCLGGSFLWLALFEAAFGVLLAFLYFNLAQAELMSRP